MRAIALALLLASNAYADATANATVTNRTPTTLTRADGTASIVSGPTLVRLGDVLSYSFDFRLEVRDDGLRVSDETRAGFSGEFYSPTNITPGPQINGGIPVNSAEIAYAAIFVSGPTKPWESLAGPSLVLATRSDEIAEHEVLEGSGSVSFALLAGWGVEETLFTLPELRIHTAALTEPRAQPHVSPVPEPATWVAMLVGLAGLGLRYGRSTSSAPSASFAET